MSFYTDAQRAQQDARGTRALADRLEAMIVLDTIDADARGFIESRDFFFLATVDGAGRPTVSHKGGPVGVVRVLDERTLVFPSYDGNGMYLSLGNLSKTAEIGLLFIDFETPHRIRVQARATLSDDPNHLGLFPGAEAAIRAEVAQVFVNCPRYIRRHVPADASRHVPTVDGEQPLPSWKRIDAVQDVIRPADRARVPGEGGEIGPEDYARKVASGDT